MENEPIVAIALLTQRELDRLGTTFKRFATVPDDDTFADLLAQLDEVEVDQPIARATERPQR